MKTAPTLHTERLILCSFTLEDALDVQRLAGDPDVASTTDAIEHPYKDGTAEAWIRWCQEEFKTGKRLNFAITLRTNGTLIGTVSLLFLTYQARESAELGYWIGKPYWNCGYCTEAAKAAVAYGLYHHDIELVYAYYFKRNPASGRVLEKIGMRFVKNIPKDPERYFFEDTIQYSILKCEFIENEDRTAPAYRKIGASLAYA